MVSLEMKLKEGGGWKSHADKIRLPRLYSTPPFDEPAQKNCRTSRLLNAT